MHSFLGMVTVTCCGCPGTNVPPGGLKVTPGKSLDADQTRSPWEPCANANASVHMKLPLLSGGQLPPPLAVIVGGEQVHDTVSGFTPPDPVKVKVSFLHGAKMDTEFCPLGDRIPFCGLKVAPTLLLADQVIFPVEFASSVKVT